MLDWFEMLDRAWLLKINATHHPFVDRFMWLASESWHTWLLALACGVIYFRKMKRGALAFLVGCAMVAAASDFSSNAVKHGVKRHRPTHNTEISAQVRTLHDYSGGRYGFVSSHAANSFSLTMFVFLCFRWINRGWRLLYFLYPAIVSYSRMYLGVHYPSDIFFGMLDGLLFGWMGYLVMNAYFLKLNASAVSDTAAD